MILSKIGVLALVTDRIYKFLFLISLSVGFAGSAVASDMVSIELTKALERSDTIAAARQGLRASVERITVANKSLDLTTTLSVTGTAAQTSANEQDFTSSDSSNLSLTVKKPIYDGGLADAETSAALLVVERARIGLAQAEQAVLQESLSAYVNLVAARDRVVLEKANVNRLEKYLKATQVRLNVGEATPTDLAATRARLARAQASLITAESDLATAEETYQSLIGVPPVQIDLPQLPPRMPETIIAAGDAAEATSLSHRLVMIDQRDALASLEVLTSRVRPNINLEVTGKTMEADSDLRDSDEVSASLVLSMPIFVSTTVRAASRAAVADHRSAIFAERDSKRDVRLRAENAQRLFLSQNAVIKAFEAELESATLFRDGTRAEADFGLKTVLDVLDAEQDVVSAEVSLLLARRDSINAGYAVLAAIGLLNADTLGLSSGALAEDNSLIELPIRLKPLPTLVYPE